MKIAIPITLAEPLTIPWDLMVSIEIAQYQKIYRALRQYLDSLKRDGLSPGDEDGDVSYFTTDIVKTSLRVITRKGGGLSVTSLCRRVILKDKCIGHVYHVYFKLRKGGLQREMRLRS